MAISFRSIHPNRTLWLSLIQCYQLVLNRSKVQIRNLKKSLHREICIIVKKESIWSSKISLDPRHPPTINNNPASFAQSQTTQILALCKLNYQMKSSICNVQLFLNYLFYLRCSRKVISSQLITFLITFMQKILEVFSQNLELAIALTQSCEDLLLSADRGDCSVCFQICALRLTRSRHPCTHYQETWDGLKETAMFTPVQQTFSVVMASSSFAVADLNCGVHQGSILGPLLLSVYMVIQIIQNHSVGFQCYADDTQLYIPLQSSNSSNFSGISLPASVISNVECPKAFLN